MRSSTDSDSRVRRALGLGALVLGLSGCERPVPVEPSAPGLTVLADAETEDVHFPHYHDFGKVRHGALVERTFVVQNGDPRPVTVQSIQTACQCTRVRGLVARDASGRETVGDVTREGDLVSIPVGGELLLTLAVDTGTILRPNADKLSVVRVRTDASTPFLTFELHVIPQKLFELSPPQVRLDEVPIDHGQTTPIRILRGDPSFVADIVGVKSTGERLSASIEKDFHFDDPVWTVHLTVPPGEELGPFRDELVLTTTDDEGNSDDGSLRELPVPVNGHYVENVRLYPRTLSFGTLEAGEAGQVDAYLRTLVPGARVKVERAEMAEMTGEAAGHVRVECVPRAEDGAGRSPVWEVYLSTDGELAPGPFSGRLRIELDDSQNPLIERAVTGEVVARDG